MIPITIEEINTRIVDELDSSLIERETNTGIHIAIVKASIRWSTVQVGDAKNDPNITGSKTKILGIKELGNPTNAIKI